MPGSALEDPRWCYLARAPSVRCANKLVFSCRCQGDGQGTTRHDQIRGDVWYDMILRILPSGFIRVGAPIIARTVELCRAVVVDSLEIGDFPTHNVNMPVISLDCRG